MKLHTERTKVRGVAAHWHSQYPKAPNTAERHLAIGRKLEALDTERATARDVNAIIGNKSWTRIHCNECNRDVPAAVELGEEPDYESATATICIECLRAALALAPSEHGGGDRCARCNGTGFRLGMDAMTCHECGGTGRSTP